MIVEVSSQSRLCPDFPSSLHPGRHLAPAHGGPPGPVKTARSPESISSALWAAKGAQGCLIAIWYGQKAIAKCVSGHLRRHILSVEFPLIHVADSPSLLIIDVRLGNGGTFWLRIVSFVSSRACMTRLEDCAMDMIDVEAWSKSRYRSLYIHYENIPETKRGI